MNRSRLLSGLALLMLTGCAEVQLVDYDPATTQNWNFFTFSRPFTDQAAADALASARKLCEKRKQVPIETSNTCSLTKCTTQYQCVDSAEVSRGRL